jgi:hypothetical protein
MVKEFKFLGKRYRMSKEGLTSTRNLDGSSGKKKNRFGVSLPDYRQDTFVRRAFKDKSTRNRYYKYQSKGGKKSFLNWLWEGF